MQKSDARLFSMNIVKSENEKSFRYLVFAAIICIGFDADRLSLPVLEEIDVQKVVFLN